MATVLDMKSNAALYRSAHNPAPDIGGSERASYLWELAQRQTGRERRETLKEWADYAWEDGLPDWVDSDFAERIGWVLLDCWDTTVPDAIAEIIDRQMGD